MFFFTGSFLYRPGLANRCEEAGGVAADWCTSSSDTGTWLFVVGSLLYLIESLLSFASSAMKHKYGDEEVNQKEALLREGATGAGQHGMSLQPNVFDGREVIPGQ